MSNRIEKLNAEFRRYIAEILTKKVKDPRITEMFTVTEVLCDKELETAKVFVSIYSTDPEKGAATFRAICENEPYIRREISRNMHIYKAPEFRFMLDTSMAYGQKIDDILKQINHDDSSNG